MVQELGDKLTVSSRVTITSILFCLVGLGSSCRHGEPSLVIVHVLRDPARQVASSIETATYKFDLGKPHVSSGRGVMIATNVGSSSYPVLLKRVDITGFDLVILNSQSDLSTMDGTTIGKLGPPTAVCGGSAAYLPSWVTGESREAASVYLQFLAKNCQ